MNKIKDLVMKKDWNSIISNYSFQDVCSALSFREAMHVVNHLFYDDIQNDDNQQYALNMAYEIRKCFEKEWEDDWKNDVFLGNLCEMLWLYDQRYFYYKKAYDKLKDPPSELLLFLSICNSSPDAPPISDEQAEEFLKRALEKKLTCEGALKMRGLFRIKKKPVEEMYWDKMYKQLEKQQMHSDQIIPDVLK